MPDYRRILLIKPSSLGDIVHAMPTLAALRRAYPSATVTWLVKRQWSDLVERIDGVDRVWAVDQGMKGWLSQVSALRAARFDVAVDLQGLFRSAAMGWLSGAPHRVGFANAREGSPWWYNQRVPVPTVDMHAVDRYLLVAKAMGAIVPGPVEFRFRTPQADHDRIDQLLREAGVATESRWVAMNVSARWPTKRWPSASFAALADRLVAEGFGPVLFMGGPDEREDVAAVREMMKAGSFDLSGALPVGLLPAFLSKAALLITNDSGPMHIAAAVGTPVVALFGPTSPVRTGPYGPNHAVLTHKIPCSPCFRRSCRNAIKLECLNLVSPEQVMAAVRTQLASRMASR
ncbi:MAG TPA: lipopolysaccharide heptosyltransferase II [Nitrospira sp.]|nr:lipopolysaccharide heptosyltransferase II [Nitrospira sp.]